VQIERSLSFFLFFLFLFLFFLHTSIILFYFSNFEPLSEVVSVAIALNGLQLEHASAEIRNDLNMVLAAILNDGRAVEFASEALKLEFWPISDMKTKFPLVTAGLGPGGGPVEEGLGSLQDEVKSHVREEVGKLVQDDVTVEEPVNAESTPPVAEADADTDTDAEAEAMAMLKTYQEPIKIEKSASDAEAEAMAMLKNYEAAG